jgi:hypothetical protein
LLKKAVVNIYLYDKYDSETARLATENPVRWNLKNMDQQKKNLLDL